MGVYLEGERARFKVRIPLFTVFVAVDHCAGEYVGIHIAKSGDRFKALEPAHQGIRERFGRVEEGIPTVLNCHGTARL